jgi:hypothetical protein
MQIQRATAMDAGQTAGMMGIMTRAGGADFKTAQGRREFENMMKKSISSGLDHARMPEFLEAATSVVQTQARYRVGDVGTGDIASVLERFGQTGLSGLLGARGGAVAGALEAGFRAQGGSEAGRALMLRSQGFGKPGGTTSYYEASKALEKGLTEENLSKLLTETRQEFGGGEKQILALQNMFPQLTKEQLEGVRKAFKEGDKAKIEQVVKDAQPLEKQSLEAMKESGTYLKDIAELQKRDMVIGAAVKQDIETIRDEVNKVVMELLPSAVQALRLISELITGLYEFMVQVFGGKVSEAERAAAHERIASARSPAELRALQRSHKQKAAAALETDMPQEIMGGLGGMAGVAGEVVGKATSGERLTFRGMKKAFGEGSGIAGLRERQRFHSEMAQSVAGRQALLSGVASQRAAAGTELGHLKSLGAPAQTAEAKARAEELTKLITKIDELRTAMEAGNEAAITAYTQSGGNVEAAIDAIDRRNIGGAVNGNRGATTTPTTGTGVLQ